jgi:hypothetical protein
MILVPLLNLKFAIGRAAETCELQVRGTSLFEARVAMLATRLAIVLG